MQKLILKTASTNYFFLTYLATLLLSFHYYFVTYINSSYISQFIGNKNVGVLYAIGSILNLMIFFKIEKVLRKHGNYKTMLFFLAIEFLCLSTLSTTSNTPLLVLVFIVHHAINPMLIVSLDIFLEHFSDDKTTGATRGIFLTIMSTAAVISPIIVGSIINNQSYQMVYAISSLFIIALFGLIYYYFKNYRDVTYREETGVEMVEQIIKNQNIKNIFIINTVLQIFYSWMIVFIPIYLHEYLNFDWSTIGIIISISLLPFVFFEIPLGELADKKIGEKEILIAGIIIIIISLFAIGETTIKSSVFWAVLLTIARTGASFVEVGSETHFFKQINEDNEDLTSFWRASNPVGFLLGTLSGTAALIAISYNNIFFVLGFIMMIGLYYATRIKDTL